MAWGAPGTGAGVEEWVKRLVDDDPTLTSIVVFRTRNFGSEVRLIIYQLIPHTIGIDRARLLAHVSRS